MYDYLKLEYKSITMMMTFDTKLLVLLSTSSSSSFSSTPFFSFTFLFLGLENHDTFLFEGDGITIETWKATFMLYFTFSPSFS